MHRTHPRPFSGPAVLEPLEARAMLSLGFAAPAAHAVSFSSVRVADIDGDSHADLVGPGASGPDAKDFGLYALFGRGDGTFGPAVRIAAGLDAAPALVGDFDGDGDPDLLAPLGGPGPSLIRNDGGRVFTLILAPAGLAANTAYSAAADFDGDGDADLAGVRGDGALVVTLGGPAGFAPGPESGILVDPLAELGAARLDLDAAPDLLARSPTVPAPAVLLLGDGQGGFTARPEDHRLSGAARAADFNGDGLADLWWNLGGTFHLADNIGAGVFFEPRRPLGPGPAGDPAVTVTAAADFTGDGRADLVQTTSWFAGSESRVRPAIPGGFAALPSAPFAAESFGSGTVYAGAGDVNGDDRADAVLLGFGLSRPASTSVAVRPVISGPAVGGVQATHLPVALGRFLLRVEGVAPAPGSSISAVRFYFIDPRTGAARELGAATAPRADGAWEVRAALPLGLPPGFLEIFASAESPGAGGSTAACTESAHRIIRVHARQYAPEGSSADPDVLEEVGLVNPSAELARYTIIARHSGGERDTVIARGTLRPRGRKTITVFDAHDRSLSPVRAGSRYTVEVQSNIPVGATFRRTRLNNPRLTPPVMIAALGEVLTGATALSHTHAGLARAEGSALTLFNPTKVRASAAVTFTTLDGVSQTFTLTLRALRPRSVRLIDLEGLSPGRLTARIDSTVPIVAAHTRIDTLRGEASLATIAPTPTGPAVYLLPLLRFGLDRTSSLALHAVGGSDVSVSITLGYADDPRSEMEEGDVLSTFTLRAGRARSFDLNNVAPPGAFGRFVRIRADAPLSVRVKTRDLVTGDLSSTALSTVTSTGWTFDLPPAGGAAGGAPAATLAIYNPLGVAVTATVRFIFTTGRHLARAVEVPAGRSAHVGLAGLAELDGHAGRFALSVESGSGVVAGVLWNDRATGAWETLGSVTGRTEPL